MPEQLKTVDYHVHDALLSAQRQRGLTAWEIAQSEGLMVTQVAYSLERLRHAGYVEFKWHGQKWVSEGGSRSLVRRPGSSSKPNPTPRYYRSTAVTRQTLEARIQSEPQQ